MLGQCALPLWEASSLALGEDISAESGPRTQYSVASAGYERQFTPICEMKQRHRGLLAWPRSADQGLQRGKRHFQSAQSTDQGVRPGQPGMRHAILQGQLANFLCSFLRSQPECKGRWPPLMSPSFQHHLHTGRPQGSDHRPALSGS